jgi:endo-1,4-beta-xylanase
MSRTRSLRGSTSVLLLVTCVAQAPLPSQRTPSDTISLRAAVNGRFLIGTAVNADQFEGRDTLGERLVREQFTSVSPENVLKWKNIHPDSGRYAFADADAYVDFAQRNGLVPIGHTLIWGDGTPEWVFRGSERRDRSREAVLAELKEHIATIVGRYRGRIRGWDVVNEVLADDGTLRPSPWLAILGEEYILTAFRLVRQADPSAELYVTEYGLEEPRKLAGMVRLLQRLASSGIRVDAIGIQGHYQLASPPLAGLDTAITTFERLGYKVMLTELDVDVLPRPQGQGGRITAADRTSLDPFVQGLPDSVQTEQADLYAEIFRIVLRHPRTITRVTFWGVDDGASWRNDWPIRGRTNYALLFDRLGTPKPAYWATITTLTRRP